MEFLSNRSVNYLNLHNGFVEMLNQIVLVFGSLFLYEHGFSMAEVFFMLGFIPLGRIFTRILSFPLIRRIGLRNTVAVGLVGWCTSILLLAQVQGIDSWFVAYVIVYTLFNPIYWVCFHTYYTIMGEEKKRGRQYAVRSVCILIGQAVFPLISSIIIRLMGYHWYFGLAVPISTIAFLLLMRCPDRPIPEAAWNWSVVPLRSVGVSTGIFKAFY